MARSQPRTQPTAVSPIAMAEVGCYNINESNTRNFKAAVKAGSALSVAFMGDSTVRGVDEGAVPYSFQYSRYAMPMRVADKLNDMGIAASADNWYGISGANLSDYVNRDSRITVGGTSAMGGLAIQGGNSLSMSSATATMTYSTNTPCNAADIHTIDFGAFAGGTLSYSVDGGPTTNIVQVGNNTFRKTTISLGTLGYHTITITQVSGSNALYGIECYNTARRPLTIRQWGTSGGTSSGMIDNTGAPSSGRLAQIAAQPPTMVISECGIVNSWRNSRSVANCITDMQTLITAVKNANSDFIFLIPPYDNGSAGLTSTQDDYVKAMYALADSNNVGVIDIRKYHESFKNAVLQGYMRANDAVHLSRNGYDHEAEVISKVIMKLTL